MSTSDPHDRRLETKQLPPLHPFRTRRQRLACAAARCPLEPAPINDSAEEPSIHPSRVSGRTEALLKSLEIFPFMLSVSKHSWGSSAES